MGGYQGPPPESTVKICKPRRTRRKKGFSSRIKIDNQDGKYGTTDHLLFIFNYFQVIFSYPGLGSLEFLCQEFRVFVQSNNVFGF